MTLLHWAADRNHIALANFLLDSGVDIDIKTTDNETPFYFAALAENRDLMELLMKRGAFIEPSILDDCTDDIRNWIQSFSN
jgi:ankyrin repeat protein